MARDVGGCGVVHDVLGREGHGVWGGEVGMFEGEEWSMIFRGRGEVMMFMGEGYIGIFEH